MGPFYRYTLILSATIIVKKEKLKCFTSKHNPFSDVGFYFTPLFRSQHQFCHLVSVNFFSHLFCVVFLGRGYRHYFKRDGRNTTQVGGKPLHRVFPLHPIWILLWYEVNINLNNFPVRNSTLMKYLEFILLTRYS